MVGLQRAPGTPIPRRPGNRGVDPGRRHGWKNIW